MFTIESITKIEARIKVDLNTAFSNPLLVNEEAPPHTRPNPVPLFCTRIKIININEVIDWAINRASRMDILYLN